MKNSTKMIIAIILAVWILVGVVNFFQAKNLEKPFLTFVGHVDSDGNITYLGLGYSFIAREEGGELTYIEMYACGFKVVTAGER